METKRVKKLFKEHMEYLSQFEEMIEIFLFYFEKTLSFSSHVDSLTYFDQIQHRNRREIFFETNIVFFCLFKSIPTLKSKVSLFLR